MYKLLLLGQTGEAWGPSKTNIRSEMGDRLTGKYFRFLRIKKMTATNANFSPNDTFYFHKPSTHQTATTDYKICTEILSALSIMHTLHTVSASFVTTIMILPAAYRRKQARLIPQDQSRSTQEPVKHLSLSEQDRGALNVTACLDTPIRTEWTIFDWLSTRTRMDRD